MSRTTIAILALALVGTPGDAAAPPSEPPVATGGQRDTLLYVRTDPPGATVILNGKELGTSNGLFRVDPGEGKLKVRLEGRRESEISITLRAQGVTRVHLELRPQAAAQPDEGVPAAKGPPSTVAAPAAPVAPAPRAAADNDRRDKNLRTVKPALGVMYFRPGDSITVTEVRATSPQLKAGDTVTVKGRYVLGTESEAKLSFLSTAAQPGAGRVRLLKEQEQQIAQGSGTFELTQVLPYDGFLHLTLYSTSTRKPFGGMYFGTGPQMMIQLRDRGKWDLQRWYSQ